MTNKTNKKITDEDKASPVKVWIRVYILSEKDFYAFGPNFKPNSTPTLIAEQVSFLVLPSNVSYFFAMKSPPKYKPILKAKLSVKKIE